MVDTNTIQGLEDTNTGANDFGIQTYMYISKTWEVQTHIPKAWGKETQDTIKAMGYERTYPKAWGIETHTSRNKAYEAYC